MSFRARSIGLIRIRKTHPSTTLIRWDEMRLAALRDRSIEIRMRELLFVVVVIFISLLQNEQANLPSRQSSASTRLTLTKRRRIIRIKTNNNYSVAHTRAQSSL